MDAKAISKAYQSFNYGSWKWAGSGGELRLPGGRTVEVGGCEHDDDKNKYQGQPHDGLFFDELPQFTESQYTFIIGWNRPANPRQYPNQRCRVVGAGNPPTDPEGEWVLRRWRAWMPGAERPAKPGELRWYTTVAGEEVECPDGNAIVVKGVAYQPRSRTFIPARLEDNPDLMRTGYAATLEAMPEPLRSMLRHGDMMAARQDDRWQLVPTKWVHEAQKRWLRRKDKLGPLRALGVDVAMSGADQTVVATRHGAKQPEKGATVGRLVKRKGKDTPDGQSVVALLMGTAWGEDGEGACVVNVDAIGIGKSAVDVAKAAGMKNISPVVVSNSATWRDPRFPAMKFLNTRAAMMWRVRSLLDPEGGPDETRLALPPDSELLADLTAPRYSMKVGGLAVESKDDIRDRIGRSTDCFVAGTPVLTDRGHVPIERIRLGDRVWTRVGLRRVAECGRTSSVSQTRTVVFSDGRTLRGTPDHPIFVDGKGFVPIDALAFADRIITCESRDEKRQWCLKGWPTLATPTASLCRAEITSTASRAAAAFIRPCGNPLTAPSLTGTTYTTAMRTRATTHSTTSNCSPRPSTTGGTATKASHSAPTSSAFGSWRRHGTPVPRDWRGMPSTVSERGTFAAWSSERARCARSSTSARAFAIPTDFALAPANSGGIIATRPTSRRRLAWCAAETSCALRARSSRRALPPVDSSSVSVIAVLEDLPEHVYNLTVEGVPEYFANGVLVHNCGDAVALACWERPAFRFDIISG